ncbi:hypothetical protein GCM10023259_014760 [Thermocatellispora tengchongensis]
MDQAGHPLEEEQAAGQFERAFHGTRLEAGGRDARRPSVAEGGYFGRTPGAGGVVLSAGWGEAGCSGPGGEGGSGLVEVGVGLEVAVQVGDREQVGDHALGDR